MRGYRGQTRTGKAWERHKPGNSGVTIIIISGIFTHFSEINPTISGQRII